MNNQHNKFNNIKLNLEYELYGVILSNITLDAFGRINDALSIDNNFEGLNDSLWDSLKETESRNE